MKLLQLSLVLVAVLCVQSCGGSAVDAPITPTVNTTEAKSLTIAPLAGILTLGDTLRLVADARNVQNKSITGRPVTWSVADASVASISSSGLLTAVAPGTTTITAALDGVSAKVLVSVVPRTQAASITVAYTSATLARGQAIDVRTTLRDKSGTIIPSRPITWTSSDPTIVKVATPSAAGSLQAASVGTATVTATVDSISAQISVTVIAFGSITAGEIFSCAITTDDKLYCAGVGYDSLAIRAGSNLRFSSVSSGARHACAIATDRRAYCWGENDAGQLGIGNLPAASTPTAVSGNLQFASISAGDLHTCGISTAGDAYCWGEGSEGRLGNGDALDRTVPTPVRFPDAKKQVAQIEAGAFATCARDVGGTAYCWGRNDLGQLGSTATAAGHLGDFSLLPVLAASDTKWVSTKGPRSCVLDLQGHAFCFGNNTVFELGVSNAGEKCYGDKPCQTTPIAVETTEVFTSLALSQFGACGLTAERKTFCWGLNFENIFGNVSGPVIPSCRGSVYDCVPKASPGPTGFVTLSGSRTTTCGMRDDGVAYCWGGNNNLQRGWGGRTSDPTQRAFGIFPTVTP